MSTTPPPRRSLRATLASVARQGPADPAVQRVREVGRELLDAVDGVAERIAEKSREAGAVEVDVVIEGVEETGAGAEADPAVDAIAQAAAEQAVEDGVADRPVVVSAAAAQAGDAANDTAADDAHEVAGAGAGANGTPAGEPRRQAGRGSVQVRRVRVPAHRAYNSARRTWLALVFFPVFAIWVVVEGIREASYRRNRGGGGQLPAGSTFRRHPAMPKERSQRSVQDVVQQLKRMPFRPLPLPTSLAFFREYGAEGFGVLFASRPDIAALPGQYPAAFRERLFAGHDGVHVAGMQAMHEQEAPALIVCHGLLTSKNFDYIRTLARKAHREWGFHVVTLDLRGWGASSWTSEAPSSGGYMEGLDVLEVARALRADGRVTSVGVIGFSLGGATVLNAAHHSSTADDTPIDGGVFAISAPTDLRVAIDHISRRPHWRDPFFPSWVLFKAALRGTVRKLGLDMTLANWSALVTGHSAPWYGVDEADYCRRSSAVNFAHEITVPTLELHARDDFMVPVTHAEQLAAAASDNDSLEVWIVDSGNHCAFTAIDSRWFYSITRRWFEYWATDPQGEFDDEYLM